VDFLVWTLAVLVVLGSLVMLVQVGRHLWRHTKKLGSTMGEAADRVASATAELQSLSDELAARQAARGESDRAPRGR
jgi:hypothetical protein